MIGKLGPRVLLKWTAVALAALAVAYGTQIMTTLKNDVQLTYSAPAGELTVTLFDAHGKRIRRTQFDDTNFKHTVVLPQGEYEAELVPAGLVPHRQKFTVSGDMALEISYPRLRP